MRAITPVLLLSLVAIPATADLFNDCEYKAQRQANVSAAGASRVVVIGRAGTLKVHGVAGATEVRASGTACTSEEDSLSRITLSATRQGSEVRIEAIIPESSGWSVFNHYEARLDLDVAVPAGAALMVKDGSGEASIENVASVDIDDGSGELTVRNIHGNVKIEDGSGTIEVSNVVGDVVVDDGSGEIDIQDVGGSVLIDDDGSGSVDIRNVRQNVTIEDKGSGGVQVSDVAGNFVVNQKGSGSIDYERVKGSVQIPERNHRH